MEPKKENLTTGTLLKRLLRTSSFDRFKRHYSEEFQTPELCDYITALCERRGESHESVIKRAGIDRVYGHQIFCGMRQPTRDKVIQLAIGFGLCTQDAQTLLRVARKSELYPRVERDAAILYCLHHRLSFVDTQLMLEELGMSLLGGDGRRE